MKGVFKMIKFNGETGKFGYLNKYEKEFVEKRLVGINLTEIVSGQFFIIITWMDGKGERQIESKEVKGEKIKLKANIFDIQVRIPKTLIEEQLSEKQ